MSGNYALLQSAAQSVTDKTEELRVAKSAAALAEQEQTQAQTNFDLVVADLAKRTAQVDEATADETALTSEQSSLETQRTSLKTSKKTKITDRDSKEGEVILKKIETDLIRARGGVTATEAWLVNPTAKTAYELVGALYPTAVYIRYVRATNDLLDDTIGNDGDYYFVNATGAEELHKRVTGSWTLVASTVGTDLAVDSTFPGDLAVLTASGTPTGTTNGQFHIDTDNGNWYGPRDGTWGAIQTVSIPFIPLGEKLIEVFDDLNEAEYGKIIVERNLLDDNEPLLASRKQSLQDLKDQLANVGGTDAAIEAQIAILEDPTDTPGTGSIAEAEKLVKDSKDAITASQDLINDYNDKLSQVNADLASLVDDLRLKESELATLRSAHDTLIEQSRTLTNQLEDIEGKHAITSDLDVNDYGDTGVIATPDRKAGSNLDLVVVQKAQATLVKNAFDAMKGPLETAKGTRQGELNSANTSKTGADAAVVSKTAALEAARTSLNTYIENQKKIEVDAAVLLLESFLKNASVVLASGATLDPAVVPAIDKTCPSAKIRTFVDRITASFSDEAEYAALRDEIRNDPVNSFFNIISDPCFNLLSEEDVAALRAEIKANFGKQAEALFAKYYPRTSASSSSNVTYWVIAALVILAIVAIAAFFLM